MENKDIVELLQRNFNLKDLDGSLVDDDQIFEEVKKLLAEKIKFLIRTDLDKLLQILYRIDLEQSETDKAFAKQEINQVSLQLAEGIIYRQLKKREYARKFKKDF